MGTRVKRVLAVVATLIVAAVVGVGFLAYRVLNPTDCYDHAAVGALDADPVEDVRPDGAELVTAAQDPQCNWIEPRREDASRSWTFAVADASRVDGVVADLAEGAAKAGWRDSPASGSVPGSALSDGVLLEMTKQVDSAAAQLVVTAWTVEALDATEDRPVGTTSISVMTQIIETP